ncbi:unnamed protein product [Microthlaspi erraticum]|uniref:F-box domain-containing protein n=1 Tax=Microthlaspi erraticum TaxID=1685480 RepID=A0A6D2I0V8_9BRAS|nr:unnamed protein product [Microthlaspi erraticum]
MEERSTGPMLVCKTWMNVCQDPSFNLVFDLDAKYLALPTSNSWLWGPQFEDNIDSLLRSVVDRSEGALTEIRVWHCTDRSISYVAERCPNLEELDISCSYEISCLCIEMVAKNCKNLEILKRNMMDPCEVERLEYTRFVPQNYLDNNPIDIYRNVDAHTIVKHMRHLNLKHLELRFSTLTDKAFDRLCKACSSLEYLDLFGCKNLTSDGVSNSTSRLKNLKKLKKPNFTAI